MRTKAGRHGIKAFLAAVTALGAVAGGGGAAHAVPPFTWDFVGFGQVFCIVNNATPKQVDFRVSPYGTWTVPLVIRVEVDIPGVTYETLPPIPPMSNVQPRQIEETITIFIPPNFPIEPPDVGNGGEYIIATFGRDQIGEQRIYYDPDSGHRDVILSKTSCDPNGT